MQPVVLHWCRRQQRSLSRVVLAAFCLTWLQFAMTPCVMALDSAAGTAAVQSVAADAVTQAPMPEGMAMAPGEHCRYCPPPAPQGADPTVCSFPHDPQVDSRVGFAAALLAPPPALVLFVVPDSSRATAQFVTALAPAPMASTSLAVSLCRFLK
jgi:hypothetical protein